MNKSSILDSVAMLAVMGILAGVLGGLAVGVITGRPASPSTSSATAR
jgi:hypothetical protein